jgi:hypothetical protein
MKSSILLLAIAAVLISSCSTAYKTGQTPDDVYFSPAPPADEYVNVEKKDDRSYKGEDYYEDRYLRMRVQNRYRWSVLDDYYFNNPYAYTYYGGYYSYFSPYNSYWAWNNYYNPYCNSVIIIKNPGSFRPPPSKPVAFNVNSYTNTNSRYTSRKSYNSNNYSSSNSSRYNNSNSNSSFNNSVRKLFSNSNSNSNSYSSGNNNSTPSRSYNPSSSSSSGGSSRSSSSSSSGGGVSRPNR